MKRRIKLFAPLTLLLAAFACTCGPVNTLVEGAIDSAELTAEAALEDEMGNMEATIQAEVGGIEATPEEAPTEEAAPEEEEPATDDPAPMGSTCEMVSTDAIADILGGPVTADSQTDTTCAYSATETNTAATVVVTDYGDADSATIIIDSQQTAFEAEAVEGYGDAAIWIADLGTFTVRQGSVIYSVTAADATGLIGDPDIHKQIVDLFLAQ